MSTRKRSTLAQGGSGGAKTRPTPVRPATREFKPGLMGGLGRDRIANRAASPGVTVPKGSSVAQLVQRANRWREQYNPLRGLTIARAVCLVEQFDRGEFADLQWTYRWIERHDETLSALVTRRESAIRKLDWNIKVTPDDELPAGATPEMAEMQAVTLRTAYDRISNLRAAVAHLVSATFRGFAHLEKQDTNGDGLIDRLEPVDQWNIVRDGLRGDWYYNSTGTIRGASSLGSQFRLDPANFVVREVERHVDWIALFCHIRKGLSQKDWDAFVEGYGLNPTTVIGPPGVPRDREMEYANAAQDVAEHGTGYLPNGSEIKYANSEKGQAPFKDHADEQKGNIVLAGTGGKLTMLNGPTGLGSGQSDSHADTFNEIACADAMDISELLNEQFDKAILAAAHAGQPVLAYFELAANEETKPKDVISDAKTLFDAGFDVDADELAEKSGYKVTRRAAPAPAQFPGSTFRPGATSPDQSPTGPVPEILNRAIRNTARKAALAGDADTLRVINTARGDLFDATAVEMAPLRERLDALSKIEDPDQWRAAVEALAADVASPESPLRKSLGKVERSADVLAGAIGSGLVNGFASGGAR